MKFKIESAIDDKLWCNHPKINKLLIKTILKNIIQRYKNLSQVKNFELSILFTGNARMLAMNKEFRNRAKATNVLSFPENDLNYQHLLEYSPDLGYMYLGDIAFGYQIIVAEAKAMNKSFEDHWLHLLVHGILHLLGYDHEITEDCNIMQQLEVDILKDFDLKSPY